MKGRKDAVNIKRGSRHAALKKDMTARTHIFETAMPMEDIMRSQYLIARMSGKPEPKEIIEKVPQDKKKGRVMHKRIWAEEDRKETEVAEPSKNSVDAWIKKLQIESEKEDNQGAFVYLRQEDPGDPYSLMYCTYSHAEKAGGRFYTLSKKGFTSYFRGVATEFLTIVEWIMERELYEQIKSFKFFKLFRLWRAIKFWRHNVIYEKRRTVKETLERKMMLAKKGFARLLIEHRASCRRLESQRLFDISEPDEALTLKQFESMQEAHMKKMTNTILDVSNKTKDKFLLKITKTLDKLKKKIRESQQRNEEEKETLQQQTARNAGFGSMGGANQNVAIHPPESGKLMAIDAVYEHLGFQSNLSYAHRTDVRKECKMFIRFSYLLDFIAKTSLKDMYVNSMEVLDQYLSRHNDIKIPSELPVLKATPEFVAERSTKPVVLLQVSLKEKPVEDREIKFELVDAYERAPIGKIDENNFDPTCHLQLLEAYQAAGGAASDISPSRLFIEQKVKSAYVDSPMERWLKMSPEVPELARTLKQCVVHMLEVVKTYERHSKNEMLHPYASVLEEWDEKVADKWEVLEDKRLSCEDILEDQPEYINRDGIIEKHMQKMKENLTQYLMLFNMNLVRFWRYSRIPWELVTNDKLREPVDVLTLMVKQMKKHKEDFSFRVPSRADIGFCKLNMQKFREKIIGAPTQALKKMDTLMPDYLVLECQTVKDWLERCMDKVQAEVTSSIKYVAQIDAMKYVETNMEHYANKREVIRDLIALCKNNEIKCPKDELYNELAQLAVELSKAMGEEKDKGDRRKEEFKLELKKMIEAVKRDTEQLNRDTDDPVLLDIKTTVEEATDKIDVLKDRAEKLNAMADQCNQVQRALEIEVTAFDIVDDVKSEINMRGELWSSLREFTNMVDRNRIQEFNKIETNLLSENAERHTKVALRCENRGLKDSTAVQALKREVIQFKETMPVVEALSNKRLKDVHWKEIKEVIGTELPLEERNFTLDTLITLNAAKHKEEIHNISVTASQEYILKHQIKSIKEHWEKRGFVTKMYVKEQQRDQVTVITESEQLFIDLDDTLSTLNNIIGSRYVRRLLSRAITVKQQFDLLWQVADEWVHCQRNWLYLDSIFSSNDIRSHLKKETSDFEMIDKTWRPLTRAIGGTSRNILLNYANPEHLAKLQKMNKAMDKIKKELQNYLETKRKEFPRFYFLSDGELLPIMSRSTDINAAEPILPKCFDGIVRLDLGPNRPSYEITGMYSAEDEHIGFKNVRMRGEDNVVIWLKQVEGQMVEVLKKLIKSGYTDYFQGEIERTAWVLKHYAQVVSCVTQLIWTEMCEYSIKEMGDDDGALFELAQQNIASINQLIELIRGELTPLQRSVIIALITTDVHWRDIIDKLATESVADLQDFLWQVQLRYYFDEAGDGEDVKVKQVNSQLMYGYEYIGAASRLVVTPLTERCYLTITSALHINLGASPAGPAGTGKTETVKDLSKALAIQCVVFNCSEQIEIKIMARLFAGLAQQGAWTCLDEFNRIDIEVLSVIAQQVLQIRDALRNGTGRLIFNEIEIQVKSSVGIFVTMNPNYSGRTELPDNLKILFRPISMMIPDYALIAEILLFAQGFQNAKILALKMTQLYKLASEQLSQQDHYDFGMRAIKSVLVIAGSLKKREPTLDEDKLLIRAMRDANVPKFLSDDLLLFLQLVQDLFPGVELPETDYGALTKELRATLDRKILSPGNMFVQKTQQLFESLNVRFGVMIIGLPGVGKTTCYEVLQEAMTALKENPANADDLRYQRVESQVICPKSISLGELYGEESKDTKEWKYGIASKLMKKAAATVQKKKSTVVSGGVVSAGKPVDQDANYWFVFDGPVDSKWIENMNSVLDDSRMLCLANAERIKLPTQMRILFEVQDLSCASLATVSRCGMVYISPGDLGWKAYLDAWARRVVKEEELFRSSEDLRVMLTTLLDETVEKVFNYLDKIKDTLPVPVTTIQALTTFTASLLGWIKKIKVEEPIEVKKRKLMAYYAFAMAWSFGGALTQKYYATFDDAVRPLFPKLPIPFTGTILDYKMEETETGFIRWKSWKELVPAFRFSLSSTFFSLFVPTSDTEKYAYLMDLSVNMLRPAFFTGETGVGKSLILRNLLMRKQAMGEINVVSLVFSATTSSLETQLTIESKLEPKKFKKVLGPPGQTKGVIFVDDVNMPIREVSGAQPPIELLRQLLTYGGFYSRTKPRWIQVIDNTVCCAAGPPGGGRNALSQRFTQRFSMFCVPEPSEETLRYIFESILMGFLQAAGFNDAVKKSGSIAVAAAIDLYGSISKSLKPTPSKFHYIYNLRDLAKVFQCMLMTNPKSISSAEVFARLWVHECMRIFGDRLVAQEDRDWLQNYVVSVMSNRFRYEWTVEDIFVKRTILFTDIYRLYDDVNDRPYEEITDIKKLARILDDALLNYNQKNINSKMDLVFFDEAVCYITRIERTLRQKRGSCLLIGVSGCGKESYTTLASSILESRFFKIRIGKNYRRDNFKDDIKGLMHDTGIEGKTVTFMMNDSQLTNELFLEDINSVLNTGEINNLYKSDEMDAIIRDMSPVMIKLKRVETKEAKYTTFLERIRDNLHIVLSMSPVGESFRSRCRKFPSLINCCTLIYFDKWPGHALRSVCAKALSELGYMDKGLQTSLTTIFPQIHLSVEDMSVTFFEEVRRKFYVTPKSYIDAIKFFISSLEDTRELYSNNIDRLSKGLRNFHATTKMVAQLQNTLTKLKPIIEENTLKANKALEIKEVEAKKVAEEDAKIEAEKNILYQQQALIEVSKAEAKKELDTVQPMLDEARLGLESLDPKDITQIRMYNNPPKMVTIVMQAVLVLVENDRIKQDWARAKTELVQGAAFIKRLKALEFSKLSESTIRFLRGITINFDATEIKKADPACISLSNWCVAMQKCYEAYQKVAPQEEKLKRIEAEYKIKMAEVKVMEDALEVVKQKLRQLEAEHRKLSDEARQLNDTKDKTIYQLSNAEQLIGLLGEEGERWTQTVSKLKEEEKELIGNIFLSAASTSYIGPFTMKYRQALLTGWQELCKHNKLVFSPDYSIIKTLGNPMEMKRWNLQGLPADHISMENGILATKTRRWPLMIDPEGQANKWIHNMEKANDLTVVKMSAEGAEYVKAIDRCVQGGKPLLLEDAQQEFDSSLYTVLGRKTFKSDVGERINFGDKDIPYDPHFRLYLTCKQPNPHFLPEICIMLNVINFAVTFEALEEQLLVEVIIKEKPEVEEERTKRITEIATYQKQLRDIEADILEKLTNTTEDTILSNVDLISSLEKSKKSSIEIEKNIKEAVGIEQQVNKAREQYREIATRGAILYFVLVDIAKIDPMYQYSFSFLKKLFNDALSIPVTGVANIDEKKLKMIENITKVVYRNICRGLFELHKLVFSFLISTQISIREGKIQMDEWDLYIRGAGVVTKKNKENVNPLPNLMSDSAWNLACAVEDKLGSFNGLTGSMAQAALQWSDYANLKNPYLEPKRIPAGFGDRLTSFQRLILMRILKPEKVRVSSAKYVDEMLGTFYTENPSVRIDDLFADSNAQTPIIFVLSQGADPTEQLKTFARESKKIELAIISLGKEQELRAEKELNEAKKAGRWLMLQNCHLAKSFMPRLETLVGKFDEEESLQSTNPQFRLLLSSMPADYFPISVLQNGLKYTTEPPAGVRANMLRTYCDMRESEFEGCKKPRDWKLLLYGLSMFHAVVQERRKFGPLGWNVKYEFNETDLATSKTMLNDFLTTQDQLSWEALCFITGNINYGGRVTDDWDRKLLICLFHRFLNPALLTQEKYAFTEAGTYVLPKLDKLAEYQGYVQKLPEHDEPDIFGMHDNADITFETRRSDNLLLDVLQIQPKIRPKSAGRSNDEIVLELVTKLKEALPEKLEKDKGLKEQFTPNAAGMINSLSTVLIHEMEKYNHLLSAMSSSLERLEKAVTGEVVMSQELDDMYTCFLMFKVPPSWHAYDSLKALGGWYPDLISRVQFMRNWMLGGLPSVFRLSAFVFPQGFLTGTLQAHARQYQIPIDLLAFDFEVLPQVTPEQIKEPPKDGIYVSGLFLEGGAWDPKQNSLADLPYGQLYMPMNIINFMPVENKEPKASCYECPVYKTAARQGVLTTTGLSSNFIVSVDLPSTETPGKWTLRGTALLTELIN